MTDRGDHHSGGRDDFDAVFRSFPWSPTGAWLYGLVGILLGIVYFAKLPNVVWVPMSATAYLLLAGWWLALLRLIGWLRSRRGWPNRLRRSVVMVLAPTGTFAATLIVAEILFLVWQAIR